MINEKELAEAVDRLREGDDNGLLVKQEDAFRAMSKDGDFLVAIFAAVHEGEVGFAIDESFDDKFNESAAELLREAYRTKLEHEAGLM